jgi:hypothetical protein
MEDGDVAYILNVDNTRMISAKLNVVIHVSFNG